MLRQILLCAVLGSFLGVVVLKFGEYHQRVLVKRACDTINMMELQGAIYSCQRLPQ
jgi:hypothetical protein